MFLSTHFYRDTILPAALTAPAWAAILAYRAAYIRKGSDTMFTGILELLGSLGLFLYGMKVMGDGIQKLAGERMQRTLGMMTRNRFTALLTGIGVTGVIQSSSATTVMVVSFVNAGLLTLVQAVGVIFGANIGTTVTAWIVALLGFSVKISAMALPAIGIGMVLLFVKKLKKEHLGEFLVGFGLLFLGLAFLKESLPDVKGNEELMRTIASLSGHGAWTHLIYVIVGTLLTVVVQSSSATVAITQTMAFSGWIDFPSACAIVLGENIGTTITAQLASIGTNTNARRTAMAHTIFNIFGVIWISIAFPLFMDAVGALMPGTLTGAGADKMTIATGIALFHTMFNLANASVLIWALPQFTRFVARMVPEKKGKPADGEYHLKFITTSLQDTPEINILQARQEVRKMGNIIGEMFAAVADVMHARKTGFDDTIERLRGQEELTDQMQSEISRFLAECTQFNLTETAASSAAALIRIADELESIGDSCYQLILLAKKRSTKSLTYAEGTVEEIKPYTDLVQEFLGLITSHLETGMSRLELDRAADMERRINGFRDSLKKAARKRIERCGNVRIEILLIDKLQQLEHIGDFAFNIAQTLAGMRNTA
jgi:phosphate:Na+ symporter